MAKGNLHTLQVLGAVLWVVFQTGAIWICPDADFQLWNGHCYSFHRETVNWTTARERCLNKSTKDVTVDLVSIHSEEENNFVKREFKEHVWIGFYRGKNDEFEWTDGSQNDFTDWTDNQPDGYNCGEICPFYNYLWTARGCSTTYKYTCKCKPVAAEWVEDGDYVYFIIPAGGGENALNWYGARQVCKANGADLISINSKDMSDTLYKWLKHLNYRGSFWIGLNKHDVDNEKWTWSDCTNFKYTNWETGYPIVDYPNRTCGSLQVNDIDGEWRNNFCHFDHKGYICKRLINPRKMSISISPSDIIEGDKSVIRCSVQRTARGTFSWMLGGKQVSKGGRIGIKTKYDSANERHLSTLTIKDTSPKDIGYVSCSFVACKSEPISDVAKLDVLAKPQIYVSPLSVTLMEGQDTTLTCSILIPTSQTGSSFQWFRWNENITIDSNYNETIIKSGEQLSQLQVTASLKISTSVQYSCAATNRAGTSNKKSAIITITRKGTLTCDPNTAGSVDWPETAEGSKAIMSCPGDATGEAYRRCLTGGKWDTPNFNFCVNGKFTEILDKISEISSGKDASIETTKQVAQELEEALNGNVTNSSASDNGINPGNLDASLEAINQISMVHHQMFEEPPSWDEVMSIVQTCGKLIDRDNDRAWKPLLEKAPRKASIIMASIDRYSRSFEKSLETMMDKMQFATGNIVLSLEPWQLGNGSISFPQSSTIGEDDWVNKTADKVILSNETLIQISDDNAVNKLLISSAYYRTLDHLLPGIENSTMQKVGSKVLSVSVGNLSSDEEFLTPISFIFELEVKEGDRVVCSYWNFTSQTDGGWDDSGCNTSTSNAKEVFCHCDHMTNFAVLVSHYEPSPSDARNLSIITYVGCSLSIVAMLVTMLLYGVLWREISAVVRGNHSRQITLMNLCGVLVVANIIFLFGMDKTEPKGLCAAIAAILQYLYLVAFALMTVSSVTLYWKISSFTRGMQNDTTRKTVISLLVAWGIPMIIVSISLGVTKTKGYGNEDRCWLSTDGVIWSFIGPIALAILVNSIILILVIRIKIKSYMLEETLKDIKQLKNSDMIRSTLWSVLVLVPVMGTNWIFGILSFNKETVAFQYIFAILNAFQGVFIFVFQCIADASVKKAWKKKYGLTPFERFGGLIRERKERRKISLATSVTSIETTDSSTNNVTLLMSERLSKLNRQKL